MSFSSPFSLCETHLRYFRTRPVNDLGFEYDPARASAMPLSSALGAMIFGDTSNARLIDEIVATQKKRFATHYKKLGSFE